MSSESAIQQPSAQPPAFPRIIDSSFTSTEPLPPNYTRELDPSGRPYYLNHDDSSTSWYHPAATHPKQDPRFPPHIERRVDIKGRSYYLNHETKESSWMNPLKIEEMRARTTGTSEHLRTEDGEEDYWVDYTTGTVTVPRKTGIPWNVENQAPVTSIGDTVDFQPKGNKP